MLTNWSPQTMLGPYRCIWFRVNLTQWKQSNLFNSATHTCCALELSSLGVRSNDKEKHVFITLHQEWQVKVPGKAGDRTMSERTAWGWVSAGIAVLAGTLRPERREADCRLHLILHAWLRSLQFWKEQLFTRGWTEHLNIYANGKVVISERCRHISKITRRNKGKRVMNINTSTV